MTRALHSGAAVPRRVRATLLAGCLGAALSCSASGPEAPDASWPQGTLLSAGRDSLLRVLSQLERLEDTPIARLARDLREGLPDCPDLEARAEALSELREALGCARGDSGLDGLRRHRGTHHLALALPIGDGARLLLRARENDGHLRGSLRWPQPDLHPAVAALLPGLADAGPPVLASADLVLHARARSSGALDLAALVPEASQGNDLFRLRSELLSAALLDGTWEVAIYPPADGTGVPQIAAALGVRLQSTAEVATRRFLDDLDASWSLQRTRVRFGSREGVCLLGLKLLPELAPCLVTTERALVFGWNAASLRHALRPDARDSIHARPASGPKLAGRFELDLARLRQSDLHLAALHGEEALDRVMRWPWRRLVARASRSDDELAVDFDLEAAAEERGS